jgi:hypothetical protein
MIALLFAVAAALPEGHWQTPDMPQLCLTVYEQRVELTLQTNGEDRIGIEGPTKFVKAGARFNLTLSVETMHLKHISKCRKHVWDKDLDTMDFLGAPLKPKDELKLTLRFFCDAKVSAVEVCRVQPKVCRVLKDEGTACE